MLNVILLAGVVAVSNQGTAQTVATPQVDPYGVFARARGVWSTQHYPHFLAYTIAVNVIEGGVAKSKHYHLTYDAQTDKIQVNPVSDEEKSAPPVARGFLWHLQPKRQHQTLFDKKVGNPGEAVDYLGVPMLAPTYSFGMKALSGSESGRDDDQLVAQIRQEFNDPVPLAKDRELASQGQRKAIADVTSRARSYVIRLVGIEAVDGQPCYHLALVPNGNPHVLRLRDAWIDTSSFQTRQIVTDGNFTGSNVPWLISFENISGALYIVSEMAQAPIGVGEHRYEQASILFEGIAPTSAPTHLDGMFVTKQSLMTEPGNDGHR